MPKTSPINRISFTTKIYLLVILPVFSGLILFAAMAAILRELEIARSQESFRNELQLRLNQLVALHFDSQTTRIMASLTGGIGTKDASRLINSELNEMRSIDALLQNHMVERGLWQEIKSLGLEFNDVYNKAIHEYDSGHRDLAALEWARGQKIMKRFYRCIQDLSDFQRTESSRQADRIQTYGIYLKVILYLAFFSGLILAFSLAWLVSTTTTKRFKIVLENARALSRGLPPILALSGQDELALLNRTYLELYSALRRMRAKDRAVIENVADLIFVLDSSMRIKEANRACCRIFELSLEELLAVPPTKLFAESDKVLSALDSIKKRSEGITALETTFIGARSALVLRLNVSWVSSEQSYFCVAQDITELKHIERMRQDLIATVSHDLRSPLCAIQIILDRLTRRSADTDTTSELSTARANTARLLSLVNNLLDIERQESILAEFILSEHPLKPLIDDVLAALAPLAGEKEQCLINSVAADIKVLIDREKLFQALYNLVDNAVKYSPPNSTIEITGWITGEYFRVGVVDEGPEIPQTMYKQIFEKFGRLDGPGEEAIGTGLGLSISQSIVVRHGGQIGIRQGLDIGRKKGNVFWFTVPRSGIIH